MTAHVGFEGIELGSNAEKRVLWMGQDAEMWMHRQEEERLLHIQIQRKIEARWQSLKAQRAVPAVVAAAAAPVKGSKTKINVPIDMVINWGTRKRKTQSFPCARNTGMKDSQGRNLWHWC